MSDEVGHAGAVQAEHSERGKYAPSERSFPAIVHAGQPQVARYDRSRSGTVLASWKVSYTVPQWTSTLPVYLPYLSTAKERVRVFAKVLALLMRRGGVAFSFLILGPLSEFFLGMSQPAVS